MTLSQMRQLISRNGIQLTKSLGQNFLHDQNQLQKIIAAAELTGQDKVLEIGPGLGPLTELLLRQAGEVLAIEKDARLLDLLKERFAGQASDPFGGVRPSSGAATSEARAGFRKLNVPVSPGSGTPGNGRAPLTTHQASHPSASKTQSRQTEPSETVATAVLNLIHADALEYLRREARDWRGWKMVSNLPYSVASPILVELAQSPTRPERMVATLQNEVARRLIARAGDPDYGVLSLLVQLHYRPTRSFKIPASCFFPEPEVDSACVCLLRRPLPMLAPGSNEVFAQIVKLAFSQRRKMMLKLLKTRWPNTTLDQAFEHTKLSPQSRAESVSLEQFVRLAEILAANSPDG